MQYVPPSPKSRLAPEQSVKDVTLYTDGACSGNPGPGGWGALLQSGPHERTLRGAEPETTSVGPFRTSDSGSRTMRSR